MYFMTKIDVMLSVLMSQSQHYNVIVRIILCTVACLKSKIVFIMPCTPGAEQ